MHDIKKILADVEAANAALARRGGGQSFDAVVTLAQERRATTRQFNDLRAKQKELSKAFGKKGGDPSEQATARAQLKELSAQVKALEARMKELDEAVERALLELPNLPAPQVPDGQSEADNPVVRTWGTPRELDFEPVEHQVLGERLGILDFPAAARVSGSGFAVMKGAGARLERALAAFMLDLHTQQAGYEEVLPPLLVTREAMTGTGQLPKFEEDAFATTDDLFLIPTAEVPVTNLHRGQILAEADLPVRYAAYSSCFRREKGSYGRETKGLTRLHQFQKVELVKLATPEQAEAEHEALTRDAEKVLQTLGLPYRVVELCAADLGFSARRCYDLEVWLAGQKMWREISSCSHFGDFQARRAGLRYRPSVPKAKPRYVHTINGSGLAIGRTVMALMEYYQRADGGIDLPEALWPYMGTKSIEPPQPVGAA